MSQQINLFNPIFLKQEKMFSALTMLQCLALIVIGALLLAGYASYQAAYLRKSEAEAGTRLMAAQAELARVSAEHGKREKSKALEVEIKSREAEVGALAQIVGVLKKGDFGNTSGYSEYLRAFARQSLDGLWLTGFALAGAGDEIAVTGRALRAELVPDYIGGLQREQVMHGKSFASLEMGLKKAELPAAGGPDAKAKRSVEFLEFSLRSAGMAGAAAEGAGAKGK